MKFRKFSWTFLFVVACASPSGEPVGGTGGTASGGATGSGGNVSATGGTNVSSSGGSVSSGGTTSSGGSVSSGGTTSSGGSATGGVSASSGGAGGSAKGGAAGGSSGPGGRGGSNTGGTSAGGTSGGSTAVPVPSAGCSKGTARPASGTVSVANTYHFAFPASYDGKTPKPVIIGFHGCGSGNRGTDLNSTEWMRLTKGTAFEADHVRVAVISNDAGGCYNYNTDIARTKQMYDTLVGDYCVDTAHVFATGHSSGSQFIVQVLAKKADADYLKLKAVAPVAADPYSVAAPMPVMYIAGIMDNQRSANSARDTVARFRTANGCADTFKPYTPVMACKSTDGPMVDPGCIIYDNCKVPTIWCSHNDPSYSGTQHGVPCFALKGMYDFFQTLP